MPEFFVETYHPMVGSRPGGPGPLDVAKSAEHLQRSGRPVSLVRAILVPEDETCLYLFEANAPEIANDAVTAPGLKVLRILAAESIWVRPIITDPLVDDPQGHSHDRSLEGGPSHRP